MANEQNLKPFDQLTEEEQREIRSKGGKRSGEVRREKADLRRVIQTWLSEQATTDKNGNPMTGAELMAMVAVKEMSKGSARHWELLRDTAGFKPVDKVMIADVDQAVIDEVESAVRDAASEGNRDTE
jgi:hypothetical protein